ncbi:MAG: putative acyl CoA dehydrogenase [Myxococcales bacterium]
MAFPDHLLDETHVQFRKVCVDFARREIAPFANEWEEAEEFPRELYAKAAAAGLLGVSFPEEVGGSGGTIVHAMVATEALLRGGSMGVLAGLGSLGIGLPPVVQAGDGDQIDRFVRPTLAGETISALAITEPDTGSDVAGVRTTARRDGDDWVIDGAKMFITSGVRADFVTVLARTGPDKHGGLTFFMVERGMPGFTVSRALRKTGWRASDTAELAFDGVRVPDRNRIGREGGGFQTLMRNFQAERMGLAVYGHAAAEIALEEALRWARERKAFGRPLVGFQVTRHKLADMAMRVVAAKTLNYTLALRIAAGEMLVKEVSLAKNLAAEAAMSVCTEAVQIFGGMGYMRETLVERLSRDVRLLPIGGGTTEIMKEIVARSMGL